MSRRVPAVELDHEPRVSVVVPCYNYARFLPECVSTVLSQEGVEVDVVIVNDASTDASGTVADALAAADPRVQVIHHETNRGHIATYNDGLEAVTGDYVVLLSADDLLLPGSLARATAMLEAHPSVGLAYGHPTALYPGRTPPPPRTRVRNWTVWSGAEWIRRRCEKGVGCINNPEVVMRTTVHREIGYYRADLPHSGDMELWLRAATVADVGRVNGVDQAYYRVHASSMQRTVFTGHLTDLRARAQAFEVLFTEHDARIPGAAKLAATARRTLALEAVGQVNRLYSEAAEATAGSDGADDYLQFAREMWPQVTDTVQWRATAAARWIGERPPAVATVNAYRTLNDKVRWRRWRWSGV